MLSTWVFVIFLFLSSFADAEDASSLANRCVSEWMQSTPSGSDEDIHCYRLELLVHCLSAQATGSARLLDDYRFFVEQEAIFAQEYAMCPGLTANHTQKLKDLVQEAGIPRKYGYEQLDNDQWSACAKQVHTECINEYIDVFLKHRLCKDFSSFITCLHAQKTKLNCQSKLINHMVSIYDEAGNDFLREIRKTMGTNCTV